MNIVQPMTGPASADVAFMVPQRDFRSELVQHMAQWIRTADQCSNDYPVITHTLWTLFAPADRMALAQLVKQGPVWDGDVVSKTARDLLIELGLASRACMKGEQGYTVANYRGYDVWKHSLLQAEK